ncbi:MAG: bifunctional folylpolyglutamate synthase/dihydrofolate synthase [Planctomycetota bacterium]|nr:bifunctional folylpolyglutamate synthase/dihydrofolate synthase [Planctomycetota bacterium]
MQITSRDEAIAWLYSRVDFERMSPSLTASDFKLDRMRNLLEHLGNPQKNVPVVHIAGTKGKGSTAAFITSILLNSGYRVGLFTSPHIERFEERIQVSGLQISEDGIARLVDRLACVARKIDDVGEGLSPTFFELTTALAWLWFCECKVDIAVLEVGLGGRLDSTNICNPEVSVITTISRDHTHILGSRLREIATEKAGIIKDRIPVVTGVTNPEPLSAISEIAAAHESPLTIVAAPSTPFGGLNTNAAFTPSRHQQHNRDVATAVAKRLKDRGWLITDAATEGLLAEAACPVRIERLRENPTVIIDAAHNWISAGALVETIQNWPVGCRRVLIFGTSHDKDVAGLCRRLFPHFDVVILTRYTSSQRGIPVDELATLADRVSTRLTHKEKDPAVAWQAALRVCPEDGLICVAGSFFLAAEIREIARTGNSNSGQ